MVAGFRSKGWCPGDPGLKATVRGLLRPGSLLIDVRVAPGRVEVDFKSKEPEEEVKRLEERIGRLLWWRVVSKEDEPEDPLAEALRYYEEDRAWEAHEALEAAWKKASGEEKRILHGLIQAMAAIVHWQRGSRSTSLESRSLELLRGAPDYWRGWPVGEIKERIKRGPERWYVKSA